MKHISEVIKERLAIRINSDEEKEKAINYLTNKGYEFYDKRGNSRNKFICFSKDRFYITTESRAYKNGGAWGIIDFSDVDFSEIAKANTEDQAKPIQIKEKAIDWEQRRYEIAKDIFSRHLMAKIGEIDTTEKLVTYSVECADKLIKCLKEN